MNWIALAASAENYLLAWHENLALLESACLGEFRAICRVYSIGDVEYEQLKNRNLDFSIKFSGPRTTELVGSKKPNDLELLSEILQVRVNLTSELHQRISHGYKRFATVVPWQQDAYRLKEQQAIAVLDGNTSDIGFVEDYAAEANLDVEVAARMILTKAKNHSDLIRKLERLRIRHQEAIRLASTKTEFAQVKARMDEDAFLSMLM